MDKSTFLKTIKYLASLEQRQYCERRRDIVTMTLSQIAPTGDAELDGMQRDIYQSELAMWEKAIRLAAEFPNVYLELTAAYHVYGIIEWMCREAGSEKVLFGTDYPWFDPMVAAGCVVFAHIEQNEMLNILYKNARRLIDEQAARWKQDSTVCDIKKCP